MIDPLSDISQPAFSVMASTGKSDKPVSTSSSTSWFTLLPRELRLEINSLVFHYEKGPLTLYIQPKQISSPKTDLTLVSPPLCHDIGPRTPIKKASGPEQLEQAFRQGTESTILVSQAADSFLPHQTNRETRKRSLRQSNIPATWWNLSSAQLMRHGQLH